MEAAIKFINSLLYSRVLIVLLSGCGIWFSLRSRFVQVRRFPDAVKSVLESGDGEISSFGALMVSTASRVGVGNIVGVSTAICLGGPGSIFWMWVMAFLGSATAFAESTLAQLYKLRGKQGFYGGPGQYISSIWRSRIPAVIFCIVTIVTYGVGFNMLSAYNLVDAYSVFGLNARHHSVLLAAVLIFAVIFCVFEGNRRIAAVNTWLVPIMAAVYIAAAVTVVVRNLSLLPAVLLSIVSQAFDFPAIFSGIGSSCLMYGIRRGLFSNEAGIGSAPNAAASANVSHPVKQGLVQMLSVFIDTMLLCSATAFMCLCSGVEANPCMSGISYVQQSLQNCFGIYGVIFMTAAITLFSFSTIIGNFFYINNCLRFLIGHDLTLAQRKAVIFCACFVIFAGAMVTGDIVWETADMLMGIMCLLNLPTLLKAQGEIFSCLKDYEAGNDSYKSRRYECWK